MATQDYSARAEHLIHRLEALTQAEKIATVLHEEQFRWTHTDRFDVGQLTDLETGETHEAPWTREQLETKIRRNAEGEPDVPEKFITPGARSSETELDHAVDAIIIEMRIAGLELEEGPPGSVEERRALLDEAEQIGNANEFYSYFLNRINDQKAKDTPSGP